MPTAKKTTTKKTKATKAAPKKTTTTKKTPKKTAAKPAVVAVTPKRYLIDLSTDFGQFQVPFTQKSTYAAALAIVKSAPQSVAGTRNPTIHKITNSHGVEIHFRTVTSYSTQEE